MEACAWQGVGHGVGVWDQLLGGSDLRCWQPFSVCAIPGSAYKQSIAFKQALIILHVSFRAVSSCLVRPHEEQTHLAVEKLSANAVVRSVAGSSSFVRQLSYFQAGRCQPGPGVLVQVGQAPLSIRWPVHCAFVLDLLHRLVWRTTFAFRGGF